MNMTSALLALVLLTSVEKADDGGRLVLGFDAPVQVQQILGASPPRLVLDVAGAAASETGAAEAVRAGLVFAATDEPASLRVTVPLPEGMTAQVSSSGSRIVVEFAREPLVLAAEPVAQPQPAATAQTPHPTQGGIPVEGDAAAILGAGDYVIGPEDLIEVNVFELPELKTTCRVLGDGTVSLPLLGVVQAAGLTETGFEARLRDLLEARFLLDPQVTISVTEYRSKMVSVIGAVTKPGTYQMIGPRTILQMISEAGGLTKEAGSDIIILRKTESGSSQRLELDLEDLVIRGNPELNLPISPGDVVNVPVDRPIYVYVDGAVKTPGQVEGKSSRPITLLQAVARAGGLTERANLKGVHVLRKAADGTQTRLPVNLREIRKGKADDIALEDGDVIVVPETFF